MKSAFLFCAILVCTCAQEPPRAVLKGRVFDPSGAVIPGAAIQAMGSAHDSALTDRHGAYLLRLAPGIYRVSAEAPGFDPFTQESLVLRDGQTASLDIALSITAVIAQVTVKAPALELSPETRTRNFQEVLEIREVRESDAKDVGEALARLEGLWKIRKGGIANDVVLRGFQQGNINLLVDGERIFGACPNHMDPPAFHVDFAEIQQVEIIKGAFDVRDQGSLGGAVNIVSKEPSPGLRITPSLSTDSFGYYNPSLTASYSGERLYGLAGYSFRRSDPYVDGAGHRFTDYANYKPGSGETSAFDAGTGWFRFGAAPAQNQRIELAYTTQRTGRTLYPYLMMDAQSDNADRASASYQFHDLSGWLKRLHFRNYFTRVRHYMTDEQRISSSGAARPYSMATLAASKALGARAEAEFADFTAGFEGYRRNWDAVNTMRMMSHYMDQASVPDVNMSAAGLYGEYHRTFVHRLRLTAGARLDAAHSAARGAGLNTDLYWAYKGTRSTSKNDTEPSATFWLAYTLPKGLEIFAGLGHTARLPDPQERYFSLRRSGSDWAGNPNLRPTRNTESDFGISYRNRRFSLKPTLYYSRLENFITLHNQPAVNALPALMGMLNTAARSYEKLPAAIYGGELTYSVGLSRALLLSGGFSWTRGTKQVIPALRIVDRNIAEMPPPKARTALRYGTRRFFAEFETLASSAQLRVDSDLNEQPTPGYAIFNLKAGLHTGRINLAAGFDNLTNRFYYEHLSFQRDPFRSGVRVPEPGRSLYLAVSCGF